MSKPRYKSYSEFLTEVKNEFTEYENQRLFCISFRDRFTVGNDRAYIEPLLSPINGEQEKDPDLLLSLDGKDWVVIDYKEIRTTDPVTLEAYMLEMTEKYNREFTFERNVRMEPRDIVLACPPAAAEEMGKSTSVNAIPSLAVTIDDPLKVKATRNRFKSKRMERLFDKELSFPQTSDTSTQKFMRHKPRCISYIAVNVALFIMQIPNSFARDEIRVRRSRILEIMANYYPAFLRSSKQEREYILQISEGRLNMALEFLRKIHFIDIELETINDKPVEVIVGSLKRGNKSIGELVDYLTGKEARMRFQEQEKRRKKEEKEAQKQKRKEERAQKKKLEREEKERKKQEQKDIGQTSLFDFPREKR